MRVHEGGSVSSACGDEGGSVRGEGGSVSSGCGKGYEKCRLAE